MQHANLAGADLRGADFESANLRDADLRGARFDEGTRLRDVETAGCLGCPDSAR